MYCLLVPDKSELIIIIAFRYYEKYFQRDPVLRHMSEHGSVTILSYVYILYCYIMLTTRQMRLFTILPPILSTRFRLAEFL